MAARARRALVVLSVPHALLTLVWFLNGLVWPNRVVWFNGLLMVPLFLATGLLLLTRHLRRTLPYLAWAVAVLDALGLVPTALYMANIVSAKTNPDTSPDATTRFQAHQLWEQEPGLPVYALVLLALTAALQLASVVTLAAWARHWHGTWRAHLWAHYLRRRTARQGPAAGAAAAADSSSSASSASGSAGL